MTEAVIRANQWTGFYMITVTVIKELIIGVRVKTLHKSTSTEIYSVLISEVQNKPVYL